MKRQHGTEDPFGNRDAKRLNGLRVENVLGVVQSLDFWKGLCLGDHFGKYTLTSANREALVGEAINTSQCLIM